MDRNVRIARELVRIAKSIVAGEFDQTVNAGESEGTVKTSGKFDSTVTAGAFDKGNDVATMFPGFVEKCLEDVKDQTAGNDHWCQQGKPFSQKFNKDDYVLSFSLTQKGGSTSNTIVLETKLEKKGSSDALFEDTSELVVKYAKGDDDIASWGATTSEELEKWLDKIYSPMTKLLIEAAS